MSIMKTIKFPGDIEPREINDNRIEIVTYDSDNNLSMTYEQIENALEAGKIVKFNYLNMIVADFNPYASDMAEEMFETEGIIFSMNSPVSVLNITGYVTMYFCITADNTVHTLPVQSGTVPTDIIDENTQAFLVYDPDTGTYNWNNPIADQTNLGLVKAIPATPEMTEYIGIDDEGQLRVAPSNNIETDETLSLAGYAADAQVVGNKFSEIPLLIEEDGYTKIPGLRPVTNISINKESDTKITITSTLESGQNVTKQHISEIQLDSNTNRPNKIITNMKTTIGDSTTETLSNECVIEWVGEW